MAVVDSPLRYDKNSHMCSTLTQRLLVAGSSRGVEITKADEPNRLHWYGITLPPNHDLAKPMEGSASTAMTFAAKQSWHTGGDK